MKNKFIYNIDNAMLNDIKDAESNDIDDILKEEGFDINRINEAAEKNVRKILFMSKALANKSKDDRLVELASKFRDGIEKGLDKPISFIKSLIEKKELSFQFRNLEKLSEEEIKDIIRGHNLLDILEQLGDNDDHKKNE